MGALKHGRTLCIGGMFGEVSILGDFLKKIVILLYETVLSTNMFQHSVRRRQNMSTWDVFWIGNITIYSMRLRTAMCG